MSDQPLQFEPEESAIAAPAPAEPEAASDKKPDPIKPPRMFGVPDAESGGAPAWVKIPPNLSFARGKQLIFVKLRSEWTDTPWKGEQLIDPTTGLPEVKLEVGPNGEVVEKPALYRQCILWQLSVGDKRNALSRSLGDANRASDELCKQMIRAVDGEKVDWAVAGPIDVFWSEIGERCRNLLQKMFSKLHVLGAAETQDFLENCIAVRSGTG